jgi:hypothetical protein
MLNPLKVLFQYSDTVHFEVSGELARAVDKLSRTASKPILQAAFSGQSAEPSLVGSASKEGVRLHKVTPFFGNLFKPIFFGKFQTNDHKVSLVGTFEMGFVARLLIGVFVSAGLIAQIIALTLVGAASASENLRLFEPTLFVGGVILIALSGKVSGKRDVAWIRGQIENALRNTS